MAAFGSVAAVISVVTALTMRENHKTHLYDLGKSAAAMPTSSGEV